MNLSRANSVKTDLTDADLSKADLAGVDFAEFDLTGVNLTEADLAGANLTGANLSGACLVRANLRVANLSKANLYAANLSEANLRAADLDGANLTDADLTGANLYESSFTKVATLTGVKGFSSMESERKKCQFILETIESGRGIIDMVRWYTSDTIRCLAGWACYGEEEEGSFPAIATLTLPSLAWAFSRTDLSQEEILAELRKVISGETQLVR